MAYLGSLPIFFPKSNSMVWVVVIQSTRLRSGRPTLLGRDEQIAILLGVFLRVGCGEMTGRDSLKIMKKID